MKQPLFKSLFGASVLAAVALDGTAQTSVTTDPVGFQNVSAPAGTTIVVPTLVNSADFSGLATIASTTVTPSTSPTWLVNAYQPTTFTGGVPNYPTHYVEVIEGTFEGYNFDIVSNTTTALTVAVGEIPAGLVGQTVRVALRQHLTLDKLAQGSTGLAAYADSVNIFNSNGSVSTRYYDGASWVAEDFGTPAGHTIIYPGNGVTVSTSTGGSLTVVGNVKTTKTAINLYAGATNLVGELNPTAQSLLVSSNLAPALAPYADGINIFSATGNMAITSSYYSDGASMLDAGYSPLAPSATDAVAGGRGMNISVGADTVWVSKSPLAP